MPRPRTSPIHKYTKEEFISLCKGKIIADIIKEIWGDIGRKASTAHYKEVRSKMNEFGMDYTKHKDDGTSQYAGIRRRAKSIKIPAKNYLIYGTTIGSSRLKKKLIEENLIANVCSICGNSGEWNNMPLTLQLDHIDGDSLNNTLENLRILCPNCHTQTETFGGKSCNKKCYCECGKSKHRTSKKCISCNAEINRKVKNRPDNECLLKEIAESNYEAIGRKYGVTGNAIRKWLK